MNEENYSNSHAGAVIYFYLQNPFDKTNDEKIFSYNYFVKPIIQELINKKLLLYIKENDFTTILFPDENSLKDRFYMLIQVLSKQNDIFAFSGDFNHKNIIEYRKKIEELKGYDKSPIFKELKIIFIQLEKILKTKEEQEKKLKIQDCLSELIKYEWVVPRSMLKNLKEEFMTSLISNPEVLHTEFVLLGRVNHFFLHKKNVYPAVVHAKRLLEDKNDDTEPKILLQMDAERFLEGEQLKVYKNMEEELFFRQLPWYVKLFRLLLVKTKSRKTKKKS